MQGSFWDLAGGAWRQKVRLSRPFGGGCVEAGKPCVSGDLSPHQSLTRQLPPEGKPTVRCSNMASITLTSIAMNSGMTAWFALIRRLRRHLPPRRGRLSEALLISKRVLQPFRIWILPFWTLGIRISRFQSRNERNPHNSLLPQRGRLSEALLISKKCFNHLEFRYYHFGL